MPSELIFIEQESLRLQFSLALSLLCCFTSFFLSLRRWSAVRWTRCSRSSCLASPLCSSPPSLPLLLLLPPPPLPPPPLPLFLNLPLLPKKLDSASDHGPFSDPWTKTEKRMIGITDLLFEDDEYADTMIHLVKILIYFFDTCIIFASQPSHSATSLGAVILYVQCVCFLASFWSFYVLVCFCSPGICNFWRIRDVTSPVISPDWLFEVVAII